MTLPANNKHFHFITLFPQTIDVWLQSSILGKAFEAKLFEYTLYQLRDFSQDKHRSVDDVSYGGGGGMVIKAEPLALAVESIWDKWGKENCEVIYFSPLGEKLSHSLVTSYAQLSKSHLILVCGHYEGVDQRFLDHWVDKQISLGDFVMTGGELAAIAFTDSVTRQFAGVLGNEMAPHEESFSLSNEKGNPLLEYPHYTRPSEFRGHKVPEVLLSGNHALISDWRSEKSQELTNQLRPDLAQSVLTNSLSRK
jgi:tRNA (guanine37-N1)-methyltransferase